MADRAGPRAAGIHFEAARRTTCWLRSARVGFPFSAVRSFARARHRGLSRAPPPESPTRTGTARPTAKAVQGHRIPHAFLFPTFRPGRGVRIVGRVERAWTDGCVRAAAAARGRGAVASLHVGAWQGHSGCCQAGLLECWWVLSVPRARVGTRPGFSRRPGEADLTAPPPGKRSGYADAAAM